MATLKGNVQNRDFASRSGSLPHSLRCFFFNFESSLLVSSVPRRWWVTAMERIIMGNYQITSLRYQPRSCNLDGAMCRKKKLFFSWCLQSNILFNKSYTLLLEWISWDFCEFVWQLHLITADTSTFCVFVRLSCSRKVSPVAKDFSQSFCEVAARIPALAAATTNTVPSSHNFLELFIYFR